ncbi:MAG TPA: ATP-grasp domain-containing protein [Planococcus sp. (in: firmicutes)]|nr:ATP-grasp domain-containing protein [Planococcus sp. (in: firmicutes)]
MEKINVLVTGIGGPTAQGVLRGLQEKGNVFAVGADRREITSGNQFCDKTYQIPRYTDTDAYKNAIISIIKNENIHAIFPSLHEEIEIFKQFRHELAIPVALPVSSQFDVMTDKEKVYEFLAEKGLQSYIPNYAGFSRTEDLRAIKADSFKDAERMVVKQVNGYGSLGFAILTDRPAYLEALKKGEKKVVNLDDYLDIPSEERRIAMDYLDGTEFSVDLFLDEGKVVVAVPRERTGVSSGIVLDGKVVYNEELIRAATEVAEALAEGGFLNLQFMTTDNGYKLTDVNARFCGSQVMSLGAGVNFPYLFLQYTVLGEKERPVPRWNTRMIRFRDHFFIYED